VAGRPLIQRTRSVIPSLFTSMNLFSGFIAIKCAMMDANYEKAAWFIVLGAIFDTLDGLMARLTHSASEFGVELDSLADVVTFGVAPSAIIYKLFFFQYAGVGMLVAALPAICGALRLARFNVQLVGFDKDYFRGLPIPSAALFIVSFVVFHFNRHSPEFIAPETFDALMFVVTIGASALMVSTVKYETMPKFSGAAIKKEPWKFVVVLVAIVAAIVTKGSAIFPFFFAFALFGAIRSLVHRLRRYIKERNATALFDEDELEEEDRSMLGM
jgi:CDP-diacylglycerol---serine O-phosphatidyltransferase